MECWCTTECIPTPAATKPVQLQCCLSYPGWPASSRSSANRSSEDKSQQCGKPCLEGKARDRQRGQGEVYFHLPLSSIFIYLYEYQTQPLSKNQNVCKTSVRKSIILTLIYLKKKIRCFVVNMDSTTAASCSPDTASTTPPAWRSPTELPFHEQQIITMFQTQEDKNADRLKIFQPF